jgi:hypothetical protein
MQPVFLKLDAALEQCVLDLLPAVERAGEILALDPPVCFQPRLVQCNQSPHLLVQAERPDRGIGTQLDQDLLALVQLLTGRKHPSHQFVVPGGQHPIDLLAAFSPPRLRRW